ncbi:hypothetical protein SAMN06273570_4183 [Candidatus Pantoea floridensis]|uniref:Uncharacterized protein n=1 Tax=Candidatus Pantoea floridensis TaxID=1938870 RepID=A0A286BZZ7_9GAMM|nr:hypothetical protein BX596_1631 [Enterobacteriaceae bacterium JKS000233]SOD39729.1 hypothetical protein SAMN06273570_4183 [Pantoea floridensis]
MVQFRREESGFIMFTSDIQLKGSPPHGEPFFMWIQMISV